jgi:uncharacterized tellurite resistance protein B-like protein
MNDNTVSYAQSFASIISHVASSDGEMVLEEVLSLFDGLEFMIEMTNESDFKSTITNALKNPISLEAASGFLRDYDISDRLQAVEVALSVCLSDAEYSFSEHQSLHRAITLLFSPEEVPLITRLLELGLEQAVIEATLGLHDGELEDFDGF